MAVKPSDFKSDVYTNSTTLAQDYSRTPLVCTLSAQSTPEQRQKYSNSSTRDLRGRDNNTHFRLRNNGCPRRKSPSTRIHSDAMSSSHPMLHYRANNTDFRVGSWLAAEGNSAHALAL